MKVDLREYMIQFVILKKNVQILFTDRYVRKSVYKGASKYAIKKSETQNMYLEETCNENEWGFFFMNGFLCDLRVCMCVCECLLKFTKLSEEMSQQSHLQPLFLL